MNNLHRELAPIPICENREEDVDDVVRQRPAVVGIGRSAPGIIGEDIWQ